MKRNSTLFLQIVIVIIGIAALAFMLGEPHLEGRNVNATTFEVYFKDPFLAYAYTASIFFFVALYKVFTLLRYIGQNKIFSENSVKALRTIKYCAMTLVAFIVGAEAWLFLFERGKDDIAGGVFMGLLLIVVAGITVSAAVMFEKIVQNGMDIKSGNTVTT
jgi:hypothetical protein